MQKWAYYNSCKFQNQDVASNWTSWWPPTSFGWLTIFGTAILIRSARTVSKKKKKFQHLHPHCSSSLEWPVIPLLILSSRFRRLSCNICLIFHLSKMYHCECTKVTKLWVASTAHIYTFYTSWHFASFWNCKWKGNSSSVLNLLVGRSNQSVSVSNRKSSVLGSFLLLKHV